MMRHRLFGFRLAGLVLLAPTACSNPQASTDANFRKALEPVVKDAFCRTVDVDLIVPAGQDETAAFPIVVAPKPPETFGVAEERAAIAGLDAFAGMGFLVRTAGEAMARRRGSDAPSMRQAIVSYAPTPKGFPYFRAVERKTGRGMRSFPATCPARGEILEIVRWSEPADLFGRKVSRVTYRYRGVEPMEGLPTDLRLKLETPQEKTVMLMLASDGWVSVR